MSICVIGKNLTALMLAKILVNGGQNVDLFFKQKKKGKILIGLLDYQIIALNFLRSKKFFLKGFAGQ